MSEIHTAQGPRISVGFRKEMLSIDERVNIHINTMGTLELTRDETIQLVGELCKNLNILNGDFISE